MKKIITKLVISKSILPVLVTTGVVAGALVTAKVIDNKNFSSEISNRKALNYTEKENEEEVSVTETSVLEEEIAKADQEVTAATEKAEKAEAAKKEAEQEVENATSAVKKAKSAVTAAKKELAAAKTEEEKKIAQAKVEKAEEEQRNAEKAKEDAEAKAKQAKEEAQKAEEEKAKKEAEAEAARKAAEEARKKAEETSKQVNVKQTESNANNSNQTYSAPSTIENSSSSENEGKSTVDSIKEAITKTIEANTLTIHNINEKWTKKYNKSEGSELIVYYNGWDKSIPAGILYSYKPSYSTTTKSLFKEMSNSTWSVPSAESIKNEQNSWTVQFSGKRSVGVIELELVKNLKYLISATPIASKSLNGAAYSNIGSNIKFYQVAVSNSKFNEWLSTYYGDKLATDTAMIEIGINSSGYVCYLKSRILGDNKTRNFEIVLAAANATKVPKASELGLSDEEVKKLEEDYKAHYDCERENDYWVCGPNKHADQSFLHKN